MALGLVGAMVVAGFALLLRRGEAGAPGNLTSVAVLPFVDMSPSGDMEYFGDGMAEEILNVLSSLPGLKVAGRTSSFSFKNKDVDLRAIGTALGVGAVLEGSVRRSAQRIRITAQLVRTDNQSHLWSQTFDRRFDDDVFAVQEEIAQEIVGALRVELGGRRAPSVATQRGTQSLNAYNAYLLGRFQWNRRTREGVLGSIESFEEAIRIDPRFARAHTGLADAYSIAANFSWMRPRDAFPRARQAADHALALDPELADAHTSLGAILSWYEWDFDGAEREFRRAIELDPSNAFAHYWYAILLDYTNRPAEARGQLDTALVLDPLALQIRNGLADHYQYHGEYEVAIREYRSNLQIDPSFHNARRRLALTYLEAGRPLEALAVLDSVPPGFADLGRAVRGWALAQLGRAEDARAALDVLEDPGVADVAYIVRGYSQIGQPDDAFRLLRAAYDARNYALLQIVHTPPSDPLRADPRFDELLADIGLLKYWQ